MDINLITRISDSLQLRKDTGRQLETFLANYVDALTTNSKDCLRNSSKVIESYAIVDPFLLPSSDKNSFKEYGKVEVKIITHHLFPGDEDKITKLLCQWSQVKFFLSGRKLQIPAGNQRSTFFRSFMLKTKASSTPPCLKSFCLLLKLGSPYPVAMCGQREEVVLSTLPKQSFATISVMRCSMPLCSRKCQVQLNCQISSG